MPFAEMQIDLEAVIQSKVRKKKKLRITIYVESRKAAPICKADIESQT